MREFTTPNGDAFLHDIILREGSSATALEETRQRARREGWSEEQIDRCYGCGNSIKQAPHVAFPTLDSKR